MEHYNKQDVLTLEELYLKLRGWDNGGVNFNVFVDADNLCCGTCGSAKMQKKGFQVTKTGRYQRYICMDCGANSRGRSLLKMNPAKNTTVPL
jgi:transposase-like protein